MIHTEKLKRNGERRRMEVVLAKSAGFCFGVKRAMEEVYSQLEMVKRS